MTTTSPRHWYTVPEVWLMLVMLAATMGGSVALVVTAYTHRDDGVHAGPAVAAPLPPSRAHPAPAP
jgi:hypothetical protein